LREADVWNRLFKEKGGTHNMNENLIQLQAKLDEAKSKNNINSDIVKLQNQLNHLKLQAELNPKAVANLTREIEKAVNQKITISNVEIDDEQVTKNARQTGQTLGQKIGDEIKQGISKAADGIKNAGRNKMLFLTGICLL